MSKVTKITDILGEKHAKKIVDSALEDLALVRQWVWERSQAWLPEDGNAPPETRHEAEAYGGYSAWWATLDAAIGVVDIGARDMLKPRSEEERQASLKRVAEARAARLAKKTPG